MSRCEFEKRVMQDIEKQHLLAPGDGVLLGVSGGADSVALFHFFCHMAESNNWKLQCVHVEHGLRGEESLQDADFVKNLCETHGVSCEIVSVGDEIERMDDTHMSLEEKARSARYKVFEQQAKALEKKWNCPVHIAVAHHSNDNVETMLFHLARGTGLDGLLGIPVVRGRIIRPFLQVSRNELEEYLTQFDQSFCVDSTNEDIEYDRNRIRHNVIPELEKINTQAVRHMGQTARLLGEVADYIHQQAEVLLQQAQNEVGKELLVAPLLHCPSFLQGEVVHLWLQQYIPGAKDVGASHINKIVELFEGQVGREYHLPKAVVVCRTYEGVKIKESPSSNDIPWQETLISKEELEKGPVWVSYGKYRISLELESWDETQEIPRNIYTKCFDYDMIENNVSIRSRQSKDYITVTKEGAHKKLQDYFVNEKIPSSERDGIPLLCDGAHVMWVMGHRISEHYKIDSHTKLILKVHMIEEKENE